MKLYKAEIIEVDKEMIEHKKENILYTLTSEEEEDLANEMNGTDPVAHEFRVVYGDVVAGFQIKNICDVAIYKKIYLYNTDTYFIKVDSKWYSVNEKEEIVKEITSKDCDIDILECGEDESVVYGYALFG